MPYVARFGDQVVGVDLHDVIDVSGHVIRALPHKFDGKIKLNVDNSVLIDGFPVATVGSVAVNEPPHLPTPPGVSFAVPPHNTGVVQPGPEPPFVTVNGRPIARVGDSVKTCNNPQDAPTCVITTGSPTVVIG